jgi:hypothetical protein
MQRNITMERKKKNSFNFRKQKNNSKKHQKGNSQCRYWLLIVSENNTFFSMLSDFHFINI